MIKKIEGAENILLSLVIVNWNTKDYLRSCLKSIFKHKPTFPIEIIVIDNASSDGSEMMVASEFPSVRLIKNQNNLGFARACNQGWRMAQGKYVLFLNPDTIIISNIFEEAIKIMDTKKEIGILGIRHLNRKGRTRRSAYNFPSPWRVFGLITGLNKLLPPSRFGRENRTKPVGYVQGSFLLTRKKLLEELDGFDENFFMYGEDADLCFRAWKKGWTVIYEPSLKIIHFESQSPREWLSIVHDYIKSLLYFYQKNFTPLDIKKLKLALKASLRLLKIKSLIYSFFSRKAEKQLREIDVYLSWVK